MITGARSFVALDLARMFFDAGIRVICTDSMDVSLCRFSRKVSRFYKTASPAFEFEEFVSDLEKIIEKEQIDYIIPTCEEIFYLGKAKDNLNAPVCCESFERLELLHNKWKFYQLLCKIGLDTPETHLWKGIPLGKEKWVIKPIYSRFAARIKIVQDNWPTWQDNPTNPLIAQKYIEGEKFCSYSICHNGKISAHSAYKILHSMGIGSGICFEGVQDLEIERFVKCFVSEIKFTGQIAFDFIRSDKLYCLECNPRATSGVHLFNRNKTLANCFFDPGSSLVPQNKMILHEHLFMLWFGIKQKEIFSKRFWKHFFLGKNPLWNKGDNRIILCLPLILLSIARETLLKKQGVHQAMSFDLEYNGEIK